MRTRRRLAIAGAVLALGCLGGGIAVASTTLAPWAESDRDAARSRYNSAEHTISASNVAQLHYARSVTTPPGSVFGSCGPGAARTVLTAGKLFFVGDNGVYAYNAATGAQLWHAGIDGGAFNQYQDIAVSAGRVFVGDIDCGSASDPNGFIQVFSASTGAQLWNAFFGTALQGLVVDGSDVVAAGASVGSGAKVAVYDAASGSTVWSKVFTNTCLSESALVVRNLVVYQTCDDAGDLALQAADLATGAVAWTKPGNFTALRGDRSGSTAHHLYVKNAAGAIVDLNPATGATRFTLAGAKDVLAVGPARVFSSCAAGVCSYDIASGAPSWSTFASGPAALANGVLYTGDGQALGASTGAQLANVFTGLATQLLVGDGRLGVVTNPRIVDLYEVSAS